jgi:hypothetical protein
MRFSIRDILWLTVVVALVVGWWADHSFLRKINADIGLRMGRLIDENRDLRGQQPKHKSKVREEEE